MRVEDLEDLCLWLIRDADETAFWMDRWATSYPTTSVCEIRSSQSLQDWQNVLAQHWQSLHGQPVMIVAHGAAVFALMAWLYRTDILIYRYVRAMMMVSPSQLFWKDDAEATLSRTRLACPAAIVVGQQDSHCPKDWVEHLAQLWQARVIQAPQTGHLNETLGGWQWGMQLMQEMLLSIVK